MFKRLPSERNKEFENNPDIIPRSAVIITKSNDKHGHVEVKTSRKECGKNKDQTCFCSDYCRERVKYRWPFKVLAVYQWNPEIIQYMKDNYH